MRSISSKAGEGRTRRVDAPRACPPWSSAQLTADGRLPDPETGLALLWSIDETVLIQGGREFPLGAGDLALVDHLLPVTIADGRAASFLALELRRIVTPSQHDQLPTTMTMDGADPIAILVKRLWEIGEDIARSAASDDLIMLHLLEAIGALVEKALAKSSDRGVSDYRLKMFERAELLIAEHWSDPDLSPAKLAASMRISPRNLSSLFAAAGTTATSTILAQRLARARALLADPSHRHRKIASIAQLCGFADASYFTRCFRREYGRTPRAFRQTKVASTDTA